MQKNLVIVESPAKAKTIEKFLGKDFKVKSSYGHIRDLKKNSFAVEIDNNYKPLYIVPSDKEKIVNELKAEANKAEIVWLASDEDREGEAISWHLSEVLQLDPSRTKRIVFHEITKKAILHAIETPRSIDYNLVDAQQARRVLDRIVGFELSPVLWKRVKPALSAGRVQSVAVRLIVEREREITAFTTESSYRVTGEFIIPEKKALLKAELNKRFKTKDEALEFLESCRSESISFTIEDISTKPFKKSPAAPFTTSTLQQEASRKLGYNVSQTMIVAQKLYEAGHITYMRTDSVNLSDLALNETQKTVQETYGEKYFKFRKYTTKTKGAQEAHEAIRPTYIGIETINGTAQENKLYNLIRKRTLACQMADAELERTTVTLDISGKKEKFVAVGEVIIFDGFLQVYHESTDDETEKDEDAHLPLVHLNDTLAMKTITATERFTQRPPRYTEASLVRRMEELGIGRPSTYAPTIQTILNRKYVAKGETEGTERHYYIITLANNKITTEEKTEKTGADKGKLIPTDIGTVVNDFLTEYFPSILDYNFTARVEKEFDSIAEGELNWTKSIDTFYKMFHPIVENASSMKSEHKIGERKLGDDPKTGLPIFVKIGRFGPVAQLGSTTSEDKNRKPQFAALMKGQSIETITLEEALKLFELPRTLGEFEGKPVSCNVGRFGPYILHDSKYISIVAPLIPQTISLEEAIVLIKDKRQKAAERILKTFDDKPELEILNGRFGPYISYNGSNYKIPKTINNPQNLTLEDVMVIIEKSTKTKPSKPKRTAKKK
ncbi:MAG: type I DNA topoisomerase [Tannerellaceae bacterium]|jgi:DNA topoisomerase-1|nr:type I DNA topoisomerase [Tannerellaceae bacterium]